MPAGGKKSLADKPVDLFNAEINPGDFVIGGQGHELAVYKVLKITPKMVRIAPYNAKTDKAKKGKLRYSNELVKLEDSQVTYYLMTH